jgi:hypothetical protein
MNIFRPGESGFLRMGAHSANVKEVFTIVPLFRRGTKRTRERMPGLMRRHGPVRELSRRKAECS